jgi:DNA-binding IclR family transcriptional regulator
MARPSPQTERIVTLVELLAAHPGEPFTLAEVTRRLGVNKSTCHSMLTALADAGWLLRDPFAKTYRLGPALSGIGRAAAATVPALDIARSAMVEASVEASAHCAALSVAGDHVTVVDQVRDMRATGTGFPIGASLPLHPPFGTAVMAWADAATVDTWLSDVPQRARQRYRHVLDVTRARGYAVELSTTPEGRLRDVIARLRASDDAVALPSLLDDLARELVDRDDVLAVDIDADHAYAASAINAPVFDDEDRVTLVLSLTGFARALSGAAVTAVGERLAAATGAVTQALRARRS